MRKRFLVLTCLVFLGCAAGCQSDAERQTSQPVTEKKWHDVHVVDYATSDPRLEPTLRIGNVFEVRTKDGGPVVLQSQVDQQRRAAELQRQENALQAENAAQH